MADTPLCPIHNEPSSETVQYNYIETYGSYDLYSYHDFMIYDIMKS